jgi:hypothetical protein
VHQALSSGKGGVVEQAALIRVYDADMGVCLRTLWPALRDHFLLACVHVTVGGGFTGCVHELLPAGRCPHRRAPPPVREEPSSGLLARALHAMSRLCRRR